MSSPQKQHATCSTAQKVLEKTLLIVMTHDQRHAETRAIVPSHATSKTLVSGFWSLAAAKLHTWFAWCRCRAPCWSNEPRGPPTHKRPKQQPWTDPEYAAEYVRGRRGVPRLIRTAIRRNRHMRCGEEIATSTIRASHPPGVVCLVPPHAAVVAPPPRRRGRIPPPAAPRAGKN